jgi:hypothetical protein
LLNSKDTPWKRKHQVNLRVVRSSTRRKSVKIDFQKRGEELEKKKII